MVRVAMHLVFVATMSLAYYSENSSVNTNHMHA